MYNDYTIVGGREPGRNGRVFFIMSWKRYYCAGWQTCLNIINGLLEKGVSIDLALSSCTSALEAMSSSIEVVGSDCSRPLAYKVDGQAYKLGDIFGYEPISEAEFLEISGGFENVQRKRN